MKLPLCSCQWLLHISIALLAYFILNTAIIFFPIEETIHHPATTPQAYDNNDTNYLKAFYYNQTLDHFNFRPESFTTFPQRYVVNYKYWGGPNFGAPIFVYFGGEAPIDYALKITGFLNDNAPSFNALIVYIEHRYYGKSIPFGSFEEAMKNAERRGYFNSAQALADYAAVITHIKKALNAHMSPVIVFGGSYGGMLASWFRLKYPHLAIGALASSAPILYSDATIPSSGFDSVITRDFREVSESCYETIKKSWSEIDRVASEADGLPILSQRFNTCRPLNDSSELKYYLRKMYGSAAQYDDPSTYPVSQICDGIDNGSSFGDDILSKIFEGMVAYKGNTTCKVNPDKPINNVTNNVDDGWHWQVCSEIIRDYKRENDSMLYPPNSCDKNIAFTTCMKEFGVSPRPDWITTYYGDHDIKWILQKFGSNIIFSNGLRDPFSSWGMLDNISASVVAITTANGSHCLDLLYAHPSDPKWLIEQRKEEVKILRRWIIQYYIDLLAHSNF